MTGSQIAHHRLLNQHLTQAKLEKPADAVTRLGAVQAQDYAGAKWALGLRLQNATDAEVEKAFTQGSLLRTHLMRPTWHFVTPADIRWILALTAPRVHAVNAYMYRKLELSDLILRRSNAALAKALQGGKQLTRTELARVLQRAGIGTTGALRLGYLMMHAELEGIVCSGARRGKQFTYALLEERVPQANTWDREESLAELVLRYFTSRGPATVQDLVWWSGLKTKDAKQGMELVKSKLEHEIVAGQTYWFAASMQPGKEISRTAHLLPNYDEYFICYKDRSAISGRVTASALGEQPNALSAHIIIINGRIVGGWKRTIQKNVVVIELSLLTHLTKTEQRAVAAAAKQYGAFLGLPVMLA